MRDQHGHEPGAYAFVPTAANRQPAFAVYLQGCAHGIQVLTIRDGRIATVVAFHEPRLFAALGAGAAPLQCGL